MIYIGFFLFFIAGICEAIMDKLQFHYESSIFRSYKNQLFWDPKLSWRNKYKNGDRLLGEKFFLSKSSGIINSKSLRQTFSYVLILKINSNSSSLINFANDEFISTLKKPLFK